MPPWKQVQASGQPRTVRTVLHGKVDPCCARKVWSITSDPVAIHDPNKMARWPSIGQQPRTRTTPSRISMLLREARHWHPGWKLPCSNTPITCELPSGISSMIVVQPVSTFRRRETSVTDRPLLSPPRKPTKVAITCLIDHHRYAHTGW